MHKNAVEIFHRELYLRRARHRKEVQGGVRRSADGHHDGNRVLERFFRHDVAGLQAALHEFARLTPEFADRDAVVLGGSTDNEFVKLAWRREHPDLHELKMWQFADTNGSLVDGLGVREPDAGVAYRATFIVDPHNVIQHVYVTNLNVGRNPQEFGLN